MQNGGAGFLVQDLPLSAPWRAQLLEATILAGAFVAVVHGHVHPAARMCLLREIGSTGLARLTPDSGPPIAVMSYFDDCLRRLRMPGRARGMVARQMDPFVGTPWAHILVRVAEAVARAPNPDKPLEERALIPLRTLRISLGLCWPTDCAS
jgi:hypothetical protein